MANEFRVKNGLIANGSATISGSVTATGNITAPQLVGTASRATTASYAIQALSASWAPGGAGAAAFPYTGSAGISGSLLLNTNTIIGDPTKNIASGLYSIASGDQYSTGILDIATNKYSQIGWEDATNPYTDIYSFSGIADGTQTEFIISDPGGAFATAIALVQPVAATTFFIDGNQIDLTYYSAPIIETVTYLGGDQTSIIFQPQLEPIYLLSPERKNTAQGAYSVAIGLSNFAEGDQSFAQGLQNQATGQGSHAEGYQTYTYQVASHAEGFMTSASAQYSHAEGDSTRATGIGSHAEGFQTQATGQYAHAEGTATLATGGSSHAEGESTKAISNGSHTEGQYTTASAIFAHAEGNSTRATGIYSHAEGAFTITLGAYSHAEGTTTTASGNWSHAEGARTNAAAQYSHAEGYQTTTLGSSAHAEGEGTRAIGISSHAEGYYTSTTSSALAGANGRGDYAHAQGAYTTASGNYSLAAGSASYALGMASATFGWGTTITGPNNGKYGFAAGQWNYSWIEDSMFAIGNGTSNSVRSNIFEVRPVNQSIRLVTNTTGLGGGTTNMIYLGTGIYQVSASTNTSTAATTSFTTGKLNLTGLPTSATGLVAGDVWVSSSAGGVKTLRIV